MDTEPIDLKLAFAIHRSHLDTLEPLSKTATKPMQQLLAIALQAFDERLNNWATAVPMLTIMSAHPSRNKQPKKGADI